GVVMATGTPITNSLTDIYVMQKYLQSGELAMLGLESFDSWVGMFAERVTEFEVDVDTSRYRMATRFSRFHNLPELTNLLSSIADFHSMHAAEGMPGECEYREELIGKTPEFADYLEDISYRAEMVRAGVVKPTDDNMLKITTDGRKAALDMRLVDPNVPYTWQNKASRCAARVTELYWHAAAQQGTQLIFCDTSVPKAAFNLYDEIKTLLAANGIPEEEIAYIHEADTEKKRAVLFEQVRNGDVRVLIGSTFKIGLGVNVQDRLIALHHLDVPWRPADMIQREGRILRPGNRNEQVFIYRYITEGSFDSYSWQLLETKQHMISELLSSSIGRRSSEDVEDTVLNYAEVKALAIGDPLIRKRIETENLLNRSLSLQKRLMESRADMEEELLAIPAAIEDWQEKMDLCRQDMAFRDSREGEKEFDTKRALQQYRSEMRKLLHREVLRNILSTEERTLTAYRGFEIRLPANMTAEKPFVWLNHFGRYYVELGDSESGDLIRVDHRIDHLEESLERFQEKKESLLERQKDLKRELENSEDYTETIRSYREELKRLDEKLGVEEHE
ncbi:MAG: hypothetical protein LUD72_08585, partial [Bacteroidales bacterium]|nr:hypothetical protein [Bacteroidales bacterium]